MTTKTEKKPTVYLDDLDRQLNDTINLEGKIALSDLPKQYLELVQVSYTTLWYRAHRPSFERKNKRETGPKKSHVPFSGFTEEIVTRNAASRRHLIDGGAGTLGATTMATLVNSPHEDLSVNNESILFCKGEERRGRG